MLAGACSGGYRECEASRKGGSRQNRRGRGVSYEKDSAAAAAARSCFGLRCAPAAVCLVRAALLESLVRAAGRDAWYTAASSYPGCRDRGAPAPVPAAESLQQGDTRIRNIKNFVCMVGAAELPFSFLGHRSAATCSSMAVNMNIHLLCVCSIECLQAGAMIRTSLQGCTRHCQVSV